MADDAARLRVRRAEGEKMQRRRREKGEREEKEVGSALFIEKEWVAQIRS